jgi:choline kinase
MIGSCSGAWHSGRQIPNLSMSRRMRAIILAAGRGSRMQRLTDERPKCLVELRGKTLLELQLAALREAGVDAIAIVTGYKRELLVGRGLVEFYNPRWAETNMVSSLACAESWLLADTCIVSYADIFYDSSAVRLLMDCSAPLAVTYDSNWLASWQDRFGDPLLDAETFRLKPDGTLSEIGNKPQSIREIDGQYMGLLRFTPASWGEVTRVRAALTELERDTMHMTGTLQKIIDAGRMPVRAVRYERSWGEIDSPGDLSHYEARNALGSDAAVATVRNKDRPADD